MIRYTTSDIIERSKELADLQNSDFITWGENMHLLDESYKKLYQEVINANDKYYLKQVRPKDLTVAERTEKEVRYYLPEDFYQLQGIVVENQGMPILKKALTESYSALRYDIIGNTLALYGGVESRGIVINYYPVPKTLTLKAPEVQVSVDGVILDCNGSKYLTYGSSKIYVTDISTGASKSYSSQNFSSISWGILGKKCAIVVASNLHCYKINFITEAITDIGIAGNNTGLVKANGFVFYLAISQEEDIYVCNLFDEKGVKIKSRVALDAFSEAVPPQLQNSVLTVNTDFSKFYLFDSSSTSILETTTETTNELVLVHSPDVTKLQMINNDMYYSDAYGVYCNGNMVLNSDNYAKFFGVNKIDFNTGYGFSTSSLDDEYVHVHSCFNDTALDFPSNFYFTFIAYQMAIAYKAKQNADASALMTRSGEEAAQFFDSISRDAAECQRIQNVYTVGGIF